ncbi:YbgA family protein [Arhodomonas aquaeolei]|uniref:YbgA family protein n=1 Tax=Arhodomonas aquaeolei TaxID=2369 RepID=UPI00037F4AA8|nr:DUF523 and DUF1722 domain-containing protein [Arhodomonas aquaeolei]
MSTASTAQATSTSPPDTEAAPIRVGVSACLLGEQVRFDSGHKRDRFVADVLADYFELIPVCPEVAIGLGTPRPPIRLVGDPDSPRAVGTRDAGKDVTTDLADYGRTMARRLEGISGYILKSKSPSCGMERVKVYTDTGHPAGSGTGIYAAEIMRANPMLPVEEEGRLNDPVLRENFIGRLYAYHRWQCLMAEGITPEALVDFHTRHKLILMSHSPERLRELGRLVARAGSEPVEPLAEAYGEAFMATLRHRATRRRHTNVLQHLMGYLKGHLDGDDKAELLELIEDYRIGRVPLIVPVTLIKHHFRRHPEPYIDRQLYLHWQPAGLSLWNHI